MNTKQKLKKTALVKAVRRDDPYLTLGAARVESDKFWRWGDDNLFPAALALMSRRSTTHRRIINDKADYISGKGFTFDPEVPLLGAFVAQVNGSGESLRQVCSKLSFDKSLFGNAFLEVVTDEKHSFLALYHQDASRCRVAKDSRHILLHHDWSRFSAADARTLPLYPLFERQDDGTLRAIVHYKDYEPMFEHYGVPPYIAGFGVSAIAYKTDRWNISRLDNSFQLSGVMMLDSTMDDEAQAERIMRTAEEKFAGNPGQVMFVLREGAAEDHSRFIPIASQNEGDWRSLHEQATSDIVVAHSWFRTLSGLDYASGFSAERILHEYEIALNTVILGEQAELLEPIREIIGRILGADPSSLEIVNRPPTRSKPLYIYESLGGPQSRRPGLRPRRRTPATFPGRNHQVQPPKHRLTMTTLVTPCEVIDLAFADGGYLPPEAIGTADIAAAEARYLLPVTGPALWQKLAEGEYPTLREEFAAPAAACAVRVAMQPALDLHGGAGGTTVAKSSACQPAGQEQLAASHRALRNRLSALLHALSDHLDAHPSDYPEYAPEKNVLHRVLIAGGLVLKP